VPTCGCECEKRGFRIERRQGIAEAPLASCPGCRGTVRLRISGIVRIEATRRLPDLEESGTATRIRTGTRTMYRAAGKSREGGSG
jgi:hypothetical protein